MNEDPRFKDPLYMAGFSDGIVDEQERIIKLLEERTGYGDSEWDADVLAIIALIKGEQK